MKSGDFVIPPGTLLVGKDEFKFQPHQELGMIIACFNEDYVKVWGGTFLYKILHMDGSIKHAHEDTVRNYYEVCDETW